MKNDLTLATPIEQLENEIIESDDIDELNDIVDLFNLNLKKKDIIRTKKLNDVQDKVVQQMYDRIDRRADEFSNSDLIQLHRVVQDTINKTDSSLDGVKVPTIQINQQVNVNNQQEFDRESRAKIIDLVNTILSEVDNDAIVVDDEEVETLDI